MDLNDIVAEVLKDSDDWFEETARDPQMNLICIIGEIGEFANEMKKVERGTHSYADQYPKMKEELTDVFIYVAKMAGLLGMDLEREYHVKRARNVERFASGSSRAVQSGIRPDVPGAA